MGVFLEKDISFLITRTFLGVFIIEEHITKSLFLLHKTFGPIIGAFLDIFSYQLLLSTNTFL